MDIKIGEYVRTNDGYIGKLLEIKESKRECDTYYKTDKTMASGFYEHIKAHSKNIIDLIEVGDFIKALDNGNRNEYTYMMFDNLSIENVKKHIKNNDYKIISIVTKEQFEENSYKVVE